MLFLPLKCLGVADLTAWDFPHEAGYPRQAPSGPQADWGRQSGDPTTLVASQSAASGVIRGHFPAIIGGMAKDPLSTYKTKRDFTASPEPTGGRPRGARQSRRYCIQKHLASHLHYDFRLEHRGVLLSWAVPKGPSLDPTVKRLAMQVEDHPYDYGDFEGVIPSGYGAGIVMLWDTGTWVPEQDDVDAGLRDGELKFTLHGAKLKGSWVLVRGSGRFGGDRGWLLIKHRDEFAGALDVTEAAPDSITSGGGFADILAADDPAIWRSNRPAKGGVAGALFGDIIADAARIKAARRGRKARKPAVVGGRKR